MNCGKWWVLRENWYTGMSLRWHLSWGKSVWGENGRTGMSVRGIYHDGMSLKGNGHAKNEPEGMGHEGNQPAGEIDLRGTSQREKVVAGKRLIVREWGVEVGNEESRGNRFRGEIRHLLHLPCPPAPTPLTCSSSLWQSKWTADGWTNGWADQWEDTYHVGVNIYRFFSYFNTSLIVFYSFCLLDTLLIFFIFSALLSFLLHSLYYRATLSKFI